MDDIEAQLDEAGRVFMAASLAQREGAMPGMPTLALPHAVGERRPNGREIDAMRATFARTQSLSPVLSRIVLLRCLRDPEWGAPVFGWCQLGRALGVSAPTVRRWHAHAIAEMRAGREAA